MAEHKKAKGARKAAAAAAAKENETGKGPEDSGSRAAASRRSGCSWSGAPDGRLHALPHRREGPRMHWSTHRIAAPADSTASTTTPPPVNIKFRSAALPRRPLAP